jgi:hypothetical protein
MSNGFGTGAYFSSQVTQATLTGSVLDFKLKKQADKKELTDNNDNFFQVAFSKRKKVATLDVLLQGSGSNIAQPNIGDTVVLASPWSTDVSGSWGVTDSELMFKSDDFAKISLEVTQWITTSGQLP